MSAAILPASASGDSTSGPDRWAVSVCQVQPQASTYRCPGWAERPCAAYPAQVCRRPGRCRWESGGSFPPMPRGTRSRVPASATNRAAPVDGLVIERSNDTVSRCHGNSRLLCPQKCSSDVRKLIRCTRKSSTGKHFYRNPANCHGSPLAAHLSLRERGIVDWVRSVFCRSPSPAPLKPVGLLGDKWPNRFIPTPNLYFNWRGIRLQKNPGRQRSRQHQGEDRAVGIYP